MAVSSISTPVERWLARMVRVTSLTVEQYWQRLLDSGARELRGLADLLERTPGALLVPFTVTYFVGAIGIACHHKLWLDEIVATYVVSLPGVADIWAALLHVVDGNPPLYYLISRLFLFTHDVSLAARLPGVIGFFVAAVCVFTFLRPITTNLAAATATLVFAESGAFRWAFEGRPYGLELGFAGIALLLWQRSAGRSVNRAPWLCGLSLAIACLVSTHYYGITVVLVLLLAELVRSIVNKHVDWSVFTAMALGSAAILFWLPLIRALRQFVAGSAASVNYFAQPGWDQMEGAYAYLFTPLIVPILVCLSVVVLCLRSGRDTPTTLQERCSAPEITVILGLAFLPVFVYAIASLATHVFVVRYVLAGAMGMGMLFGMLLHRLSGRNQAFCVLILAVLYCNWNFRLLPLAFVRDNTYEETLSFVAAPDSKLPIVVAEGLDFAPLRYYAPAGLRSRLFYVTDLPAAQHTTDATNENIMLALRGWAPEAIVDLHTFLGRYPRFFVYYTGFSGNSSLNVLVDRQCHVSLAKKVGSELLFQCDCGP